jgi:spore coat polysaccharide biosynthesis predicted glycosyltransferase SpsG
LGSDFLITPPTPFHEQATTLLITFGGSDENNLTLKTCKILPRLFQETSLNRVLVVLGLGYAFQEDFADFLEKTDLMIRSRVEVYQSVENMAKLMRLADVAVTSNGRTVYELASLGVPGVTISQNDRETLHLFSRYSRGFEYLGVAFNVDEEKLFETVKRIINDTEFRRKMKKTLDSVDLRAGICRVKREILEEYSRWKYENPNNRQKNNY